MIATLIVLVLFGLLLIMLEAFVPGGILGTLGTISILSAIAVTVFAEDLGWSSGTRTAVALGIVVFALTAIFIWLRYFAAGLFHRSFTLTTVIPPPSADRDSLIGSCGRTLTELRPLGRVQLDSGVRHEVRLLNGHAPVGARIQIVATEPGNLVAKLVTSSDAAALTT